MPKFVIEREIPGAGNLTDAQLREVSQKSVNVLKGMGPEIQWLHSYVTGDKVYCVYLAPDEATIQEHARRVGLPANRVSAVRRLLDAASAEYPFSSTTFFCAHAAGTATASAAVVTSHRNAVATNRTRPPCLDAPAEPQSVRARPTMRGSATATTSRSLLS